MKRTLLFVITQFYRGGAETALVNLLKTLSPEDYAVDLLVLNQTTQENSLLPEVPHGVRALDAGAENGAKPFSMTKKAFWLGGDAALRFVAGPDIRRGVQLRRVVPAGICGAKTWRHGRRRFGFIRISPSQTDLTPTRFSIRSSAIDTISLFPRIRSAERRPDTRS